MPIYMHLEGLEGEVTTKGHEKWIEVLSAQFGVARSIPSGGKDVNRVRGESSLSDYIVSRDMDKSSVKLWENCCKGEPIKKVKIDYCTTVKDKQEPYLQIELENCFISSYSSSAAGGGGESRPSESCGINFISMSATYITVDPETGATKGNVPAKYTPGAGKSG